MTTVSPHKRPVPWRAGWQLRFEALEDRWMLSGGSSDSFIVYDDITGSSTVSGAPAGSVSQVGAEVTVLGTDGDDRFEFIAGESLHVTLNDVEYEFDPAVVDSILFDGGPGSDTATLVGTPGDEIIDLYPDSATLNGPGVEVTVVATAQITFSGEGGHDVASFFDSAGDDTFIARPNKAKLFGDGFTNRVENVDTIHAYAKAGGRDVAHFFDSSGDDIFIAAPQWAKLYGDGFYNRAKFFEAVHGYASSGGNDAAVLYDSPGDDTFFSKPDWSKLYGDGFFSRVKFFDSVYAYARYGGNDKALVYGSSGNDYFNATPVQARFSGKGFSNRAIGFDSVTAYAFGGGRDVAELIDSPGDDTFFAKPTNTALFGTGFSNRTFRFDVVHAYARSGGYDVANLHDSPGNDTFVSRPSWSVLYGKGFYNRAKLFDSVHAYANSDGYDIAYLYGSRGEDSFVGRPDYSRMQGDGYVNRAGSFDAVYAHGKGGDSDNALLVASDSINHLETGTHWVQLSDPSSPKPRLYRAADFDHVSVKSLDGEVSSVAPAAYSGMNIKQPAALTVVNAADFYDPDSPTLGIQAAIDALPSEGGVVLVPAGTWTLRRSLVLRSQVTLRGDGPETILARGQDVQAWILSPVGQGDTFIEVDSVEGFQVGDEVGLFAYGEHNVAHPIIERIEPGRITFTKPIAASGYFDPKQRAAVVNYFALVRANWLYDDAPVSDVVIENLSFDGNFDPAGPRWRIVPPGLIHLENVSEAIIRNNTVRNAFAAGIRLVRGQDNRVENVLVENSHGHGIALNNESDTIVRDSTVRRSGYKMSKGAGDGVILNGSTDIRVENVLSEYNFRYGLHAGGDLTRGGVWTNNVSRYNGANGFHFCWNNFDITVTGNALHDNGRSGVGGLGLGGEFGNRFNLVTSNTIYNNAWWGIQFLGGSDNLATDNVIFNNSYKHPGRYSGIRLKNVSNTIVTGNRSGSDGHTPTQKYGIEEYGTADNNTITGNNVKENVLGGIALVGPNTWVSKNLGSIVRL